MKQRFVTAMKERGSAVPALPRVGRGKTTLLRLAAAMVPMLLAVPVLAGAMPPGEIGNLWVKGPSAFAEYWRKPEKTRAARAGEWVITGDKFFRDADGYYHYCGRTDDMLKVSGMWLAPGEVENALLAHSAVAEAAVVGAINSAGLTRVLACVVVREGQITGTELAQDIQSFARQRLAAYKCPQEIAFVAELPKTVTGKIQRFRLREAGGAAASD